MRLLRIGFYLIIGSLWALMLAIVIADDIERRRDEADTDRH